MSFFSVGGLFDPSRCPNVRIVLPKYLFPMPWHIATTLYMNERTKQEWLDFFKEAYSVDFYRSHLKLMIPKRSNSKNVTFIDTFLTSPTPPCDIFMLITTVFINL